MTATATPARARRARSPWLTAAARLAGGVVLAAVVALVFVFLLLPLVALFVHAPPRQLLHELDGKVARDAIAVSLKTNAIAVVVMVALGTPVAYLIGRRRFVGRSVVITLLELPLVLPPAVAGIGLLAAFGRLGLLGKSLEGAGIEIAFSQIAVVMAILFVASPFYLRGAIAAFEAVDGTLVDVAGTLGAGPLRRMLRVALPLAVNGLGAALAVAFARGLGEFGATIFFAGSFQGVTQTLPLAVYAQFEANLDQAIAIGALLVVISAVILLVSKLVPSWTRSTSISFFRGGPSPSVPRSR